MKVIINADDCGINTIVDEHIKNAIEKGKITSTTIMANMEDLQGAVALYKIYKDKISFGIHLNLTEGKPLIANEMLVDYGIYKNIDGEIYFDHDSAFLYRYKILPSNVKKAIYREFAAQIERVQECGVTLSHIDSHHHIHTSISLMGVVAKLSNENNLPKIRRMRNYVSSKPSFMARQSFILLSKLRNRKYIMTDYFEGYRNFIGAPNLIPMKEEDSLELMVHPGNLGANFINEEQMMLDMEYPQNWHLINYNDL